MMLKMATVYRWQIQPNCRDISLSQELFPVMLVEIGNSFLLRLCLTNPARMPTSVIRSSIGISRENQLPPQPKVRRWITAKDGTHYEMYGNFRIPDLDAIRCEVGRHASVFCGFSHEPGTGLPGVFAERESALAGTLICVALVAAWTR